MNRYLVKQKNYLGANINFLKIYIDIMLEKILLEIFGLFLSNLIKSSYFWNQIIDSMEIIDNKIITDADIHLKLTATLSNLDFKGNKNNPLLGLVRF